MPEPIQVAAWGIAHERERGAAERERLIEALRMVDFVVQQWRESGREPAYHQWLALQGQVQEALHPA